MPASLGAIWVPSPFGPWHMAQAVALALPAAASPAACAAPASPTDPTINAVSNIRFIILLHFLAIVPGIFVRAAGHSNRHIDNSAFAALALT